MRRRGVLSGAPRPAVVTVCGAGGLSLTRRSVRGPRSRLRRPPRRLEEPGGDVSQTEDGKITFSTPTMKGSYVYGSDGVQRKVVEIPTDSGSVDYETIMGLTVTP